MHLRLLSIGFGNVGRALAQMLSDKEDDLRRSYDLSFSFSGIYTRSAGGMRVPEGWSARQVAAMEFPASGRSASEQQTPREALQFIQDTPADVVLELTTLTPQSGQPAIDHIRAALTIGKHVVTANKGPIAYAYRELRTLARQHGAALRFESTVMDGMPIFRMAEAALPATVITGFRGLLNSTSNYVLDRMAHGETLEEAIAGAQRLGVAEADPSNDLDGWDASVKATVVANVLMDANLRPVDVRRTRLGAGAMREMSAERRPDQTIKQVVRATREGDAVTAEVVLAALPQSDLLAHLSGMEAALLLHTDTMRDLTLIEGEGGPGQTAFGILADLVTIASDMRKGS